MPQVQQLLIEQQNHVEKAEAAVQQINALRSEVQKCRVEQFCSPELSVLQRPHTPEADLKRGDFLTISERNEAARRNRCDPASTTVPPDSFREDFTNRRRSPGSELSQSFSSELNVKDWWDEELETQLGRMLRVRLLMA